VNAASVGDVSWWEMKLKDVAKKAGVGTATVSRVLNGHAGVKSSTRARVLRAVEDLKYKPNLHARSLAGRQNHVLGIVMANLYNPFFTDIYHAIESHARQHGYEILLANSAQEVELLKTSVHRLLGQQVAGLGVFPEMEPAILEELREARIPVVLFDAGGAGTFTSIDFDHRKGMRMLLGLLHDLGHRRLAYISAPMFLRPTEERRLEFLATTAYHGAESLVVTPPEDGFAGGREAARELLRTGFAPSAILCVNDWIAVGVIRELRNQGLSVPGDVSVTGFDNITLSEFCCPSLTTIHIPRSEIGRLVVKGLVPGPSGAPPAPHHILIEPDLIVRESTGIARATRPAKGSAEIQQPSLRSRCGSAHLAGSHAQTDAS
jgi:LacI family transcriptional regulator